MSEYAIQPKEGKDVKWNSIKKIGVAAKEAAKRLFLKSQDVLSEERMGKKAVEEPKEKKASPFAKLVLAGVLAAGCTDNITNNYYYGEDGGQNQDTSGDVDTDSEVDTNSDTDTETETDTECIEEILEAGTVTAETHVVDNVVGAAYAETILVDSENEEYYHNSLPVDGYPEGAFTFVHEIGDGGLPEFTNSAEEPLDRSDRHNIGMVFNDIVWDVAEFDGAMGSVKFGGNGTTYGIINVGESLTLPNGYKLRLDDISVAADEDGEHDAIMTLLDESDNTVLVLVLDPGRIVSVSYGDPEPLFVKVNMTAPGLNFIAKWAEVMVYDEMISLQNGAELNGGEKVELTIGENAAGIKTLGAIKVFRPVNECD